jgi:Sua5/YciO/YrdC/YwlC family protein
LATIIRLKNAGLEGPDIDLITNDLLSGCLLVYPTETFYGLGGVASSITVANRIFALKGRERGKFLPFIASDLELIMKMADKLPPVFFPLAEYFWPGPLTMVVKAKEGALPEELLGPEKTIAVRIPPIDWLREIVRRINTLLISTSANFSGQAPLSSFNEVYKIFKDEVELLIDGGQTPGKKPSTIIDLTFPQPVCIREGQIPFSQIQKFLSEVG